MLNLWFDGFYKDHQIGSYQSEVAIDIFKRRYLAEHLKFLITCKAILKDDQKLNETFNQYLSYVFPYHKEGVKVTAEEVKEYFESTWKNKRIMITPRVMSEEFPAKMVNMERRILKSKK